MTLHIARSGKQLHAALHDLRRLAHASRAHIAAGQISALGADTVHAARLQDFQVFLCRNIFPHASVHRRGDQHGRAGGQAGGGQHIVGDTVSQLGHDIGRSGRDDKEIGALGQGNMLHLPALGPCEGIHHAGLVGQGFKGHGRNKLGGVLCHNHTHRSAQLFQARHRLAALIRRDAARHAKYNCLPVQHAHDVTAPRLPGCGDRSAGRG